MFKTIYTILCKFLRKNIGSTRRRDESKSGVLLLEKIEVFSYLSTHFMNTEKMDNFDITNKVSRCNIPAEED